MHGELEAVGGSGTAPPRASPAHGTQMGPSASYLEGLTPPSTHSGDESCAEQLCHCLPAFGFMGFCCFGLFFCDFPISGCSSGYPQQAHSKKKFRGKREAELQTSPNKRRRNRKIQNQRHQALKLWRKSSLLRRQDRAWEGLQHSVLPRQGAGSQPSSVPTQFLLQPLCASC